MLLRTGRTWSVAENPERRNRVAGSRHEPGGDHKASTLAVRDFVTRAAMDRHLRWLRALVRERPEHVRVDGGIAAIHQEVRAILRIIAESLLSRDEEDVPDRSRLLFGEDGSGSHGIRRLHGNENGRDRDDPGRTDS